MHKEIIHELHCLPQSSSTRNDFRGSLWCYVSSSVMHPRSRIAQKSHGSARCDVTEGAATAPTKWHQVFGVVPALWHPLTTTLFQIWESESSISSNRKLQLSGLRAKCSVSCIVFYFIFFINRRVSLCNWTPGWKWRSEVNMGPVKKVWGVSASGAQCKTIMLKLALRWLWPELESTNTLCLELLLHTLEKHAGYVGI